MSQPATFILPTRTILLAIVATALMAGPASADSADCRAAQLAANGKACNAIAKCYSKGVGTAVAQDCLDKASLKMTGAYTKAETAGGCDITGEAARTFLTIKSLINTVAVTDLVYASGGKCTGKKLKATGKDCASLLKCNSAAAAIDPPVVPDPACVSDASGKFFEAFSKIAAKETCTGDPAVIDARLDVLASHLADITAPHPCAGTWSGTWTGDPGSGMSGTLGIVLDQIGVISSGDAAFGGDTAQIYGSVSYSGTVTASASGRPIAGTADCAAGTASGTVTSGTPTINNGHWAAARQ